MGKLHVSKFAEYLIKIIIKISLKYFTRDKRELFDKILIVVRQIFIQFYNKKWHRCPFFFFYIYIFIPIINRSNFFVITFYPFSSIPHIFSLNFVESGDMRQIIHIYFAFYLRFHEHL